MKRICLIAAAALIGASTYAQTPTPAKEHTDTVKIVERINASEIITIEQPAGLNERLQPAYEESQSAVSEENKPRKKGVHPGYRVQVFADNNSRTAKNQANTVARKVAGAVPGQRTYVVYESPYWRLKLGDFETREDAEKAANIIRRKFPSYASEVRVVRDRVTLR